MGRFVVAGFVLTSASRGPAAVAELLVNLSGMASASRVGHYGAIQMLLYYYEARDVKFSI